MVFYFFNTKKAPSKNEGSFFLRFFRSLSSSAENTQQHQEQVDKIKIKG